MGRTVTGNAYKIYWTDANGYSWILTVYNSFQAVGSWIDNTLPGDCLYKLEYAYERNDLELGINVPALKIGVNLQKSTEEGFNTTVTNPFNTVTSTDFNYSIFGDYDDTYTDIDDFKMGNIWILECDKGTSGYDTVFVGEQVSGLDSSLDKDGNFEIEVQDIYKSVMEKINFSEQMDWMYMNQSVYESKKFYIDYHTSTPYEFSILNGSLEDYYLFTTDDAIEEHFENIIDLYLGVYFYDRDITGWYSGFNEIGLLLIYNIRNYKQTYDGTGDLGALENTKYVLTHMTNKEHTNFADADFEVKDGLFVRIGEEYQTFWDFYKGFNESNLYKSFPSYDDNSISTRLLKSYPLINNNINAGDILDVEFEPLAEQYERLTVSKVESEGDDTDSYKYEGNFSANSQELNVPVMFNNDMVYLSRTSVKDWEDTFNINGKLTRNKESERHFTNLFYKATITGVTSGDEYIKFHQYGDIDYSKTLSISNYITNTSIAFTDYFPVDPVELWLSFGQGSSYENFIEANQTNSTSYLIAQTMPLALYNDKISLINGKVRIIDIIDNIFKPNQSLFNIPLAELTPYQTSLLDDYSSDYVLKSVKWDIISDNPVTSEIVEITFMSV